MRSKLIAILCLFVSFVAQADVSRVEATVDSRQVMVDEAIRLTVTAYGNPGRDAFDSSALLSDFVVGRTATSNRTSIINGQRSQTTTWTTTLFPRSEGTFTIPSFTIEGQQTRSFEVEVIAVPDGGDGAQPARDYYLTTEVDNDSVYLNQQILYTLKLYLSTDIERGSLTPPEMEKGIIRQIGEDDRSVDLVNGRRYQIIERKYAVIPQRSGEMTITGPVFTAEVLAPDTNQRFGFFNRTQTINRLGADITVDIKPKPDNVDGQWLPSEQVSLHEEWPENSQFVVGEPITRTLTLTATGVVEEQLPELDVRYPPGFKTYPDQTQTATIDKDNRLIAQRVESMAVIPTEPGKIILPDVTVAWFNVNTQQTDYATIPARTVSVAPASDSQGNAPMVTESVDEPQSRLASDAETVQSNDTQMSRFLWVLYLVIALLLVLLAAVIVYYKRKVRQLRSSEKRSPGISQHSEKAQFADLKKAVAAKNISATQASLQQWLSVIYHGNAPVRPADKSLTAPLQPFVDQMLASAYSSGHTEWDNQPMLDALDKVRARWYSDHKNNSQGLPPLYAN